MLEPGTVVGGYRVERLIARGGMGVLYEATQLSLGRRVALKLISADFGADPAFRARFEREARIQAALDHPNVVAVHEAGDSEHGLYIAMALVRGATLRDELDRGPLDPERALALLAPVADALDAAHAVGLVHRDIKPENVLVTDSGRALLTDFGLSKDVAAGPTLTATGQTLGTPQYLAPEQVQGDPVTPLTDVYSLAALAFECLTGSPPFQRDSAHAVMFAHVSEPRPRASERRPGVPRELDDVLIRGMAVVPGERHESAGALLAAIRATVAPAAAPDVIAIRLLGPVEAAFGGRRVPLGATKQRAVLAMLALDADATVSIDALVDGLWGDDPPATAPKMVQLYVSQLRRLLDGAEILTHGRGYRLRIAPDAVDAHRFERLLDDGRPGEALALWRGAALADVAGEPFAAAEVRRLEELRVRAIEAAIDAELEDGRHAEVVGRLEQLVLEHPLREGLHVRRMLALYRSGRQAEALEAYRDARNRLVEEVGIEPGPELRELHDRILRQDAGLAAPRRQPRRLATRAASVVRRAPRAERTRGRSRTWAAVGLGAIALAGGALALSRLLEAEGLSGIDPGAIGVIDPGDATISAQYSLGSDGGALAGGAGSVWVAHPADGRVSRVDPEENRVVTIEAAPAPVGLAFAAGSLWVASEEDGTVTQVAASTNRVGQRVPAVGNGLRAVAAGFGAIWAAAATDGAVVQIDPRAGRVASRIPVGGSPVAVVAGAGAVWAAAEDVGTVVRIDPRTRASIEAIPVGNGPVALATGAGAVWVANGQDGTVSRIDPATNRVTHTVPVGPEPVALAVAGGAVWVADRGGDVRRLDPRSQQVTERIRTQAAPSGLAVIDGELWATGAAPIASHRGGTLRVASPGPLVVDPAVGGFDPNSLAFLGLTHDGLLGYRRAGGAAASRLVPELAADLPAIADGGRRYTFRLRPGLRYSDGTPVRASDFPATVARFLERSPELTPVYESIAGVAGCRPGRCDLSSGIRTDDRAGTIELRLSRPDPELPHRLAEPLVALVPKRAGSPPPGTGPYRVESFEAERGVTLVRNRYFRSGAGGRGDGFADRIVLRVAGDAEREAERIARGATDVYQPFVLAPEALAVVRARAPGRVRSGPIAAIIFAFLNVKAPPFDDLRVRRALNLAVDRGHVAVRIGGAFAAAPTCQLLPPGMGGYRPVCPFTANPTEAGAWTAPDLDRAEQLVAASGTAGAAVAVWTTPERQVAAGHLAAVLRDLGYRARVREFADVGKLFNAAQAPGARPQMGIIGWNAEHPAPARFLRDLVACGGNLSAFCDRAIERAIDRAEVAGEAAGDAWGEIERRIARAAPVVPLYSFRAPVATSARAGNLQINPVIGVLFDQVWVR